MIESSLKDILITHIQNAEKRGDGCYAEMLRGVLANDDLNFQEEEGRTLLMWAILHLTHYTYKSSGHIIEEEQLALANLLLEHNVDISLCDEFGENILWYVDLAIGREQPWHRQELQKIKDRLITS